MRLDTNSFTLFKLCSRLALPDEPALKPLSNREFSELQQKLKIASLEVSDLPHLKTEEFEKVLRIDQDEGRRITLLLERDELLYSELARLESLGIWVTTRLDESYPPRLIERLGLSAPVLLYGLGDANLLQRRGLAVVGSRNVDRRGFELTESIGRACAASGLTIYSGGARGVDKTAMGAALAAGGTAVGLLADSLERAGRAADARAAIEEERLVLATPYSPQASFNVGTAMARNKLIYALSDFALVIASDAEKGGTWAGAQEALTAAWVPVFVVDGKDVPEGNQLLIKRGAIPFPGELDRVSSLGDWLETNVPQSSPVAAQGSLF